MQKIVGEYAAVSKVNAANLDETVKWYESIGFVENTKFRTKTWAQVYDPNLPEVSVGLNLDSNVGTGQQVTTFVVKDIVAARNALVLVIGDYSPTNPCGVKPIESYPPVQMAYFADPNGNSLALRQND
ncbi:MAG: VOC family protein [Nitrosomonadaceae bacterium]